MTESRFDVACIGFGSLRDGALPEALRALRAEFGVDDVILVARGDAVVPLHLALAKAEVTGIGGVVLATSMGAPGPILPDVPILVVEPRSVQPAGPVVRGSSSVVRIEGAGTVLTSELVLPFAIAEWIEKTWRPSR